MKNEEKFWTVAEIVATHYPHLGIPHFQRGLVWSDDDVGRLLESLFYDTPCGQIILWRPAPGEAHGVPLVGTDTSVISYYVCDGQQRLRSIWQAFAECAENVQATEDAFGAREERRRKAERTGDAETADADSQANGAADEESRYWYLNLQALPELRHQLDGSLGDRPLFVRTSARRTGRYRSNLVPLALLRAPKTWEQQLLKYRIAPSKDSREEAIRSKILGTICTRIGSMAKRRLSVIVRDASAGFDFPAMIALYNRVNGAGVRAEAEERALATLVDVAGRQATDWLADCFAQVHPERQTPAARIDRDRMLSRMRESQLGFKFFIRSLVQALAYHFNYSLGTQSTSFQVLSGWQFTSSAVGERGPFLQVLRDTGRAITHLASTIRADRHEDDLCCDDLRFLPSAVALMPAVELLVAFPPVAQGEAGQALLRWLILVPQVMQPDQKALLEWVRVVRTSATLQECGAKLLAEVRFEGQESRFQSANSLQHPLVLLLYWLLRRGRARDLSYLNAQRRTGKLTPGKERLLTRDLEPEKQHIVPYSKLRGVLPNMPERGRASSHPANNIGNLTYISHELNNYEDGIGDAPMRWSDEPPKNRRAHYLERVDGSDLREHFEQAVSGGDVAARRKAFEAFCDARRQLIVQAFDDWIERLRAAAASEVRGLSGPGLRLTPTPRFFNSTMADRVRQRCFAPRLEDALVDLENAWCNAEASYPGGPAFVLPAAGPVARRLKPRLVLGPGGEAQLRLENGSRLREDLGTLLDQSGVSAALREGVALALGPGSAEADCVAGLVRRFAGAIRS